MRPAGVRDCLLARDKFAMPAQERRGRGGDCVLASSWKESREVREEGAIGGREARPRDLAVDHIDLVTLDGDLDVMFIRSGNEAKKTRQLSNDQEGDE